MRMLRKLAKRLLLSSALVIVIMSSFAYFSNSEDSEIAQVLHPTATESLLTHSLTPTTEPTPTVRATETIAPTLAPTETLVEPTFSVDTYVWDEGFAQVHVNVNDLTFLKWDTIEVVKVVDGQQQVGTTQVLSITGDTCQEQSLLDNVRRVYQAFKGHDWHAVAAMVLTESGFQQFRDDGNGCKLLQNLNGAPAFCMMQVYLPAHKTITAEELQNTDRCIEIGRAVYVGMFYGAANGDPIQAVACYKGFCQDGYFGKDDSGFIGNFSKVYNSDGFSVDGTFVPYDENRLHELFPDW